MNPSSFRSAVYRFRKGLKAQFELRGFEIHCVWEPDVPSRENFERIMPEYIEARNTFIGALFLSGAVVEVK